jgi:protein-disulfide isomerase
LVAIVVLLLLLVGGMVVSIGSLRSEVSALTTQVEDLSARATEAQAQAPSSESQAPAAEPAAPQVQSQAPQFPEGSIAPVGADAAGAILIGDPNAANVVEVYVDYQCPYCQRWESEIGTSLIQRALEPNSGLLVKQYNLAFLGETSQDLQPPGASARAASAAACVLEGDGVETFVSFNASIFASADPSEPPTQFATQVLSDLAQELGAGDASIACIEEERFVPFAAISTQAGFARGVQGTPTVLINGTLVESAFSDPALLALAAGQTS